MHRTVFITGATGTIASLTVPQLLQGDVEVRALVRSAAKGEALQKAGCELVVGDYDDAKALEQGFQGADAAFLIVPPNRDAANQVQNLVEAAKRAGSETHLLRLSALRAAPDAPTENGRLHFASDQAVQASGLPWTLLQPHYFMQNFLMAAEPIRKEGRFVLAMGDGQLGMVDTRDIADCAAHILIEGGHEGQTYTPTGPDAISMHTAAEQMGEALGRKVAYQPVSPDTIEKMFLAMGLGPWGAEVMRDYHVAFANGWGDFTTKDVKDVTGHEARSFATFAREVLAPALR